MKKLLFLAFAMLSISLISFSQQSSSGTSMEEFNYITKGYKIQADAGLDMKKGYEFRDAGSTTIGDRSVTIHKLVRTATGKTAAYMMVFNRTGYPGSYICIPQPTSDSDVLNAHYKQFETFTSGTYQFLIYALTDIIKF